jgi:membrane-associated protease RseP (regulator of RpoE activity)
MRFVGKMVMVASALLLGAAASAQPPGPHAGWPNRGRLGLEVQSMTDALREFFAAPADRGVLVVRVVAERPASQAGIQVGDVLTSAGGEAISETLDLIAAVARVPAGEKLSLEVVRKGKTETIAVAPDGDAVVFSRPDEDAPRDGGFHDEVRRGLHEGTREILRRLEGIERRLEQMEQRNGAAPAEERN